MLVTYFFVHEVAHLLYALLAGVYKQINFMGLGVQIDVYAERMTDTQLGIFCLMGVFATLCIGYLLTALVKNICRIKNKLLRAMIYYITIALLLLDPLYLSFFCSFFGGGDMNGIALICPEWTANKSESSKKAQLPKNEENVLEMQPIENADVNATDDEIQVDYLEKTEEENSESSSENEDYPGEDVVEIVNLKGETTTVYKLADGRYMDRIERIFIFDGVDTWTDINGAEWNQAVN